MTRSILKIKDMYFLWSSVVDAPVGIVINIKEHLETYNTKFIDPKEVERFNLAGKKETQISLDEIYELYKGDYDGKK